jgi:primosomal protein N' (replication factor Y) (superfamily II helicase)
LVGHTASARGPLSNRRKIAQVARVSLLIPSHALPALSYLVPEHLAGELRVGTAVVAPLSCYSRLGIVVGFEEAGRRPLKEIRAVAEGLSLPESLVRLCSWAAGAAALPPHAVLRMALPPGIEASTYEVRRPDPGWPWKVGNVVGRAKLRRFLGGEGLKAAEETEKIVFAPAPPAPRTVEWAIANKGADLDLRRAPRQRALLEVLAAYERGRPVADLLNAVGTERETLRRLARRGAVRLERRPETAPVWYAKGSGVGLRPYAEEAKKALSRGGAWVWRMTSSEGIRAAATVTRAAVGRGEQALVLAPEIQMVERLVEAFEGLLPAGLTVAPYHSGMGRGRAAVYEAVYRGEVDVLVGTRAAVLAPVARLGAICVVDEPNEAHRASAGYEGLPIHVRDLARARGRFEGAAVFFLSPFPSLRLYAPESGTRRLPAIEPARWPTVAVVDMRGTGAVLSSALLDTCHREIRFGRRIGVVVNRLGHSANVSCSRCGFLWTCSACDLPLGLHGAAQGATGAGFLFCGRCGRKRAAAKECPDCGSDRLGGAGLAIERVRTKLANALNVEVGLLTASGREGEEAPVVAGTSRCVFEGEWNLVAVPDADSLLFGGSVEKGFRLLYRAAEVSSARLLVQTRSPEHPVLRAALRGDYEAFAATELPKRRALGYPPHRHLAEVTFEGSEEAMRRAVESRLRPALASSAVELLDPVPLGASLGAGGRPAWRVLLRSRRRGALAEAASLVARLVAGTRGREKLEARIDMDPEEVQG